VGDRRTSLIELFVLGDAGRDGVEGRGERYGRVGGQVDERCEVGVDREEDAARLGESPQRLALHPEVVLSGWGVDGARGGGAVEGLVEVVRVEHPPAESPDGFGGGEAPQEPVDGVAQLSIEVGHWLVNLGHGAAEF